MSTTNKGFHLEIKAILSCKLCMKKKEVSNKPRFFFTICIYVVPKFSQKRYYTLWPSLYDDVKLIIGIDITFLMICYRCQ